MSKNEKIQQNEEMESHSQQGRIIDHLLIDVIKLRHPKDRLEIAWGTDTVSYSDLLVACEGWALLVGTAWSI